MVQANKSGRNRVTGATVGRKTNSGSNSIYRKGLTEEQKAEDLKGTLSALEVWNRNRAARIQKRNVAS